MSLKDYDNGILHIWKQYCNSRSDGTQDLYKHTSEFIRVFLFIYGGQDENFFTQNVNAKLLPKWQEDELLAEAVEAYEATHVHYAPPQANWPPVQVFLGTPAAAGVQRNPTGEHGHGPVQPNAWQYQQPIIQEVAHQPYAAQYHAPWQNYNATTHQTWQATPQWWQGHQAGAWEWTPQPGWVATWHWQ